ncbi:inner membrane protein YbjM [Phytobacter sp. AG2a]
MKYKQSLAGIICCFILFIVVCLSLVMNVDGAFRASGHPELGLLFFILPGVVAGVFSRQRNVLVSLIGAILAAPLCLVLMHVCFTPVRSFWQELAWLFSGLFWCSLGALCYLFFSRLFTPRAR